MKSEKSVRGFARSTTSTRALADLARAGYSVLHTPSMQVHFEVHHIEDRAGYLIDLVSNHGGAPIAETLTSGANGVGLVVGTRLDPGYPFAQRRSTSPVDNSLRHDREWIFEANASPNINFLHETDSKDIFEGILMIEDEPRTLLLRHGIAVRGALREVADIAANLAKGPILALQCPVQVPTKRYVGESDDLVTRPEDPPRSSTLAVRFAIAMKHPGVRLRLTLAERLSRYCTENGLGLWLADNRIGYRAGNWFSVVSHDRSRARENYSRIADRHGDNSVRGVLPLTLVGPARIGSTHAIISYLSQFPEIGIAACSMTPLDDVAFLHIQLVINGATRNRISAINQELPSILSMTTNPGDFVRHIIPRLVRDQSTAPISLAESERLLGKSGDYQTFAGPAILLPSEHDIRRFPIWFSWQQRRSGDGLKIPLEALQTALRTMDFTFTPEHCQSLTCGCPSFEYLVCRRLSPSIVRGKGKIGVPRDVIERNYSGDGSVPPASVFSSRLEDAWTAELRKDKSMAFLTELTVSWREYWLGHWTSPL